MANLQFATFVNSIDDVFNALISLQSLAVASEKLSPALVVMPKTLREEFEFKFGDLKIHPVIKKLGGTLIEAFPNGYNSNLGFRPALGQIIRRLETDDELIYFSPRIVFLNKNFEKLRNGKNWVAKAPAHFWPVPDLYGPDMTQIWKSVVALGEGVYEDWIDASQPEGYWRRYPNGSPDYFYTAEPQKFFDVYGNYNDNLISNRPPELAGQGDYLPEAAINATIIKLGGEIIDPNWDEDLIYFQDLYDFVLRLSDENAQFVSEKILEKGFLRQFLKTVDELKIILYQNKLVKVREGFDAVERDFSIDRMQQLIKRRKIRKRVHGKLNENDAERTEVSTD